MTNRISDDKIQFPGEHLTPEQREQDRWLTMVRCSVAMTTAKSADERTACVEAVLDKFRDVPNRQPSPRDTAAYARFAVKTLLETLVKQEAASAATRNVSSVATENVFNEWIDEWLPSPRATHVTLPRM